MKLHWSYSNNRWQTIDNLGRPNHQFFIVGSVERCSLFRYFNTACVCIGTLDECQQKAQELVDKRHP